MKYNYEKTINGWTEWYNAKGIPIESLINVFGDGSIIKIAS